MSIIPFNVKTKMQTENHRYFANWLSNIHKCFKNQTRLKKQSEVAKNDYCATTVALLQK